LNRKAPDASSDNGLPVAAKPKAAAIFFVLPGASGADWRSNCVRQWDKLEARNVNLTPNATFQIWRITTSGQGNAMGRPFHSSDDNSLSNKPRTASIEGTDRLINSPNKQEPLGARSRTPVLSSFDLTKIGNPSKDQILD
jgi:hypothetical protein